MLSGAGDAAQSVACFPSLHKAEFSPPPHITGGARDPSNQNVATGATEAQNHP